MSRAAIAAALATASSLGLAADETIVLHESNKVTLRLLPCDVLARVAPAADRDVAEFEITLAQRLPLVAAPFPGVYERDGYAITLWTYYEPMGVLSAPVYADALQRLHEDMRKVDIPTPHFTDRIAQAQLLVADPELTPALALADRELLATTLLDLRRVILSRGAPEQLLHGEPHPGNVLSTKDGPLFIDLETCCRGPVEFDVAHAPEEVGEHCPDLDRELLRDCRLLVLAMVTAWRWDRDDRFPDGLRLGREQLGQIRAQLA